MKIPQFHALGEIWRAVSHPRAAQKRKEFRRLSSRYAVDICGIFGESLHQLNGVVFLQILCSRRQHL